MQFSIFTIVTLLILILKQLNLIIHKARERVRRKGSEAHRPDVSCKQI